MKLGEMAEDLGVAVHGPNAGVQIFIRCSSEFHNIRVPYFGRGHILAGVRLVIVGTPEGGLSRFVAPVNRFWTVLDSREHLVPRQNLVLPQNE